MYFLWYLLIGLAAGWIANLIVKGDGSGLVINTDRMSDSAVAGRLDLLVVRVVPVARWAAPDSIAELSFCCGSSR